MAISQVSVFVENKPGKLLEITNALSEASIDIRAMSIADTQDFGILRMIVSDAQGAKNALQNKNCVVSITKVIAVAINDKPGSLAKVVKLLTDNKINIEYMYAFITVAKENAYVVIRVEDNEKAIKLLLDNGVELVSEDDIKKL